MCDGKYHSPRTTMLQVSQVYWIGNTAFKHIKCAQEAPIALHAVRALRRAEVTVVTSPMASMEEAAVVRAPRSPHAAGAAQSEPDVATTVDR